jgi:hypothetical protein
MDTEGNTSILSLQPEGLYTAPEKSFATPQHASYAPSWNQAKCGARFGFGNRIVTFGANGKPSLISINHVPVQPSLAQKVQAFDQSLETLDIAQVLDQKIQSSENDVDKLEFTIMKALHLGSFNELLKTFGYDKTKIVQEVERCLGRKLLKPKQEQQQVQQQPVAQKLP